MRYQGLTPEQIEAHRQQHGDNLLTPPEQEPWWKLYFEKFDDPVIRILLIAAIIAIGVGLFNGRYVEGVGIIAAILLATTVAFVNEFQAQKEFELLNQVKDEEPIKVFREGTVIEVHKKDIVVSDIVLVEAGDEIPADGIVLEGISLAVDEASLTGEQKPAIKVAKEIAIQSSLEQTAYPPDQLLRGTVVVDGHGIMEVTAVGDRTEIGKLAREVATIEVGEQTPLNCQLENLSKLIGVLGLAVASFIYGALVVRGYLTGELALNSRQWYIIALVNVSLLVALIRVWLPLVFDGLELSGVEHEPPEWLENDSLIEWFKTATLGLILLGLGLGAGYLFDWLPNYPNNWMPAEVAQAFLTYFMVAIAVIVVAVPEGLTLSVVLSLAYSMHKMAQQNNLVRRLHACETVGAATVIASDKTGTLTENKMKVNCVQSPCFREELNSEFLNEAEKLIIEGICTNSTAELEQHPQQASRVIGNPTEGALLLWLESKGINYIDRRATFPILHQQTFSTERKYMATLGISPGSGRHVLHVKGAPEILLADCTQFLSDSGLQSLASEKRTAIENELLVHQCQGLRTLGFAYLENPQHYRQEVELTQQTLNLTWLGWVAISDPIRAEVEEAVEKCRQAGIKLLMITGDATPTAHNIAQQLGIWDGQEGEASCLTGAEFDQLDQETAKAAVMELKVLSRARPQHKKRVVELLQANGEVVAVTGDGTNDAPALKQAQVGLAMGKSGTAVAKEASDIILLDDSFRTLGKAVKWGRSVYQNIQRFIEYQLTINVAACGIALLGPFIGIDLPLTVTQLLWVNLIMDTFAAVALATEPPHATVMEEQPRNPEDFIITPSMTKNIFGVGSLFIVLLVGFLLFIQQDGVNDYELSLFFTTFVMLQFFNLFNAKTLGLRDSAFANLSESKGFLTIAFIILVGQVLMVQFGGHVFRTVPLSLSDWLLIVGLTSIVLWVGEGWRLLARLQSEDDLPSSSLRSCQSPS